MVVLSWLFGYPKPGQDGNHNATTTTPTLVAAATTPTPPLPPASTLPPPPQQQEETHPPSHSSPFFSQRSLRQLGLFVGGAGFLYCSVMISRKAVARHQLAAKLKFYQPNQWTWRTREDMPKREPLVAVEALNLATLNTMAFAIMAAGGVSWAFDISSLEDLRRRTRQSIVDASGEVDEAAEREVVEWVTKTFGIGAAAGEKKKGEGEGEGQELGANTMTIVL
ncbi:hypothetical protein C8A00DRAFT_47066 [Chaetomidium leptoderma]|uniref:Altered inheritance of mitochondria protein 11 n=1 Tax=Chaetomidium leptoderma TaxID=669021 RepID=A0AAN6VD52_9PEZI|nr:hypothetical protein C8A00DRAFT_47066 [Chaetomidium leptoderma]